MSELYRNLQIRLDELATGYPATESGVELKILKQLFTEKEAQIFLQMAPFIETPKVVAERCGEEEGFMTGFLEEMAMKGLVFRLKSDKGARYAASPFVIGIFEYQINKMKKETMEDIQKYFYEGFGKTIQGSGTPQLRSVPINKKIVADWPIAPYEDVVKIIEDQDRIAIANCICRTSHKLINDDACDKPIETCFQFGSHGDYYVENKMGRYIEKAEALEIIKKNDEAGLVMMPFNSKKVGGMCSCCGDCCGVLRSLRLQPDPAEAVKCNYYVVVEPDECTGCELCLERCQMEAIEMVDDVAQIISNRCIGCGLCVTTCPGESLKLIKKDDADLYDPPKSGAETYMNIAMARGKNPMSHL